MKHFHKSPLFRCGLQAEGAPFLFRPKCLYQRTSSWRNFCASCKSEYVSYVACTPWYANPERYFAWIDFFLQIMGLSLKRIQNTFNRLLDSWRNLQRQSTTPLRLKLVVFFKAQWCWWMAMHNIKTLSYKIPIAYLSKSTPNLNYRRSHHFDQTLSHSLPRYTSSVPPVHNITQKE